MDWSRQAVLVTGAGGFIGSHLVERLVERGARTRALVRYDSAGSWGWLDESAARDEVEVVAGDVRDPDSVARAVGSADVVFHLAALIGIPYSYDAPLSYVRTNVEGTLNVLRAASAGGAGLFVHTSTSEVYGTALTVPITEDHPLQAQSPYAASKIAADKLAEAYQRTYGLPVITLRPFNTFGPRQSARAVIPTIVTQLLAGDRLELGNVTPTRDFTFVADTVEAFVLAADHPEAAGSVLNVGSGTEISIAELAARLGELVGRDAEVTVGEARVRPSASEVERLVADATRAREQLGWAPGASFDDALATTVAWLREHLALYRRGAYAT